MTQVLAIILAGGRGERMDILCNERPKPVLPFAGNFRVIDFTLSNCVHSQIQDIAVLTDYQSSCMTKYLNSWYQNNSGFTRLHILEPQFNSYKGTADAVYQNLNYVKQDKSDLVLILSGDHVYKMDYNRMVDFHRQMKADLTMGVIPVPIEEAHRFGIVTIGSKERIVDFVEKPEIPQSNLASMGIYVFNKQILYDWLIEDAFLPGSFRDFGHDVIPEIIRWHNVFAFRFGDYWRDIGTPAAYYEANINMIREQPCLWINKKQPVLTGEANPFPLRIIQIERIKKQYCQS